MPYLKEKYYKHLLKKLSHESKSKFISQQRISCQLLKISTFENNGIYARIIYKETLGFTEKSTI